MNQPSKTLSKRRAPISRKNHEFTGFLLFLLPSLIGVIYFVLLPFGDAVRRSFTDTMATHFVGLRNYQEVLGNQAFQLAVSNTVRFILVCIPLLLISSLMLALLIQKTVFGADFYKTSFLLPMVIPVASMVLLWRLFFAEQGLVNLLLSYYGIAGPDWMNTKWSFAVLVLSYIWRNIGYDMILWLAGLSGIPAALYEAARVDGAGAVQCFFYITLPQLRSSLLIISVLSILNSFKVFREAYLIAGSYPNDNIYLLQHLFNNWFANLDIQKLCAAAVLMACVIIVLILVLQAAWGREDSL